MSLTAVIVAAGKSRRMGFDKLRAELAGKPVLEHSLQAFQDCEDVSEIIWVTAPDEDGVPLRGKITQAVPGGAERHHSVWNGLRAVTTEYVAVHDAARPLITPAGISVCYELAQESGAAACAEPESDTLHRADEERLLVEPVSRANLWRMQTPQIFRTALLKEAYAAVIGRGGSVTDEVGAVLAIGQKVRLWANPEWNFKITYPRDLALAEFILEQRSHAHAGH
ncbi:MAG TPA: 2-C-methyl-D-erythritol 4-phosphate cytidylyltransferase [Chthoniobacterales bacterium]